MPPDAKAKRTSFMRYTRVYEILSADNALKKRLGVETVNIGRPDQTFKAFPVEVSRVVEAIHAAGLDAHTLSKLDILRHAVKTLFAPSAPIANAAPAPVPPPEPVTTPLPKPSAKPAVKPVRVEAKEPTPPAPAPEEVVPDNHAANGGPPSSPPSVVKARSRRRAKSSAASEPVSPAKPEPKASAKTEVVENKDDPAGLNAHALETKASWYSSTGFSLLQPMENRPGKNRFIRTGVQYLPGVAAMNSIYGAMNLLASQVEEDPELIKILDDLNEIISRINHRTQVTDEKVGAKS